MTREAPHIPVMKAEVLDVLSPRDGGVYVDGTFGAGGYTRAILEAADCLVIGIDRDPAAIDGALGMAAEFGPRLKLIRGRFGDMADLLEAEGVEEVDGVALDIGVSSMQIDQAERGFSFARSGPLDMRMAGAADTEPSAAEIVNTLSEERLARIVAVLGEEKRARHVAKAIARRRAEQPFETTLDLAETVAGVVHGRPGGVHPATRTFQALRIFVNDELGELIRGLSAAERLLRPGGRLAVVSFHSLEDRIVKDFLDERCGKQEGGSRHLPPVVATGPAPSFARLDGKARKMIKPSAEETQRNVRSRSAKLRGGVRTDAPAWPQPFVPDYPPQEVFP